MIQNRNNTNHFSFRKFKKNLLNSRRVKFFIYIISFGIFIYAANLDIARNSINNVLAYTYSTISYPIKNLSTKYEILKRNINLSDTYDDLYNENQKLKKNAEEFNLISDEYLELKKLLNFQNNINYTVITSKIALHSTKNFESKFLINTGASNGIIKGNAVIHNDYLIGRITEINTYSSIMTSIHHKKSKIAVITKKSECLAVAKGSAKNQNLEILYINEECTLLEGEDVITAPENQYIPYGIHIGKIVHIDNKAYIKTPSIKLNFNGFIQIIKTEKTNE
ncbi:MAG: rod shape-determining protein MreC [Candidatus Midichloriaceae bacterium]|jgi:rod shape-determining protein MreC